MTYIPCGYKPALSLYETQTAIGLIKRLFEDNLSGALNLRRVSAPLFLDPSTGLNDDLNGIERAVSFDIPAAGETRGEVVHSLAKWKRYALYKYGFSRGEGIYTDMNAIRRDEELDNLHSVYVDQWDWEKIIGPEDRNLDYLKETVKSIVSAIKHTHDTLVGRFPSIKTEISSEVFFITSQELEDMYPSLTPKQREDKLSEEKGTIFVMQIGDKLASGIKHDGRAPDYDDWKLNGDLLFYSSLLGKAIEITSMGIRVDSCSLDEQLEKTGNTDRRGLFYHKNLLDGTFPLTIGGGIGQSRLCLLLLGKAHIGEVHASIWDSYTKQACAAAGVELL